MRYMDPNYFVNTTPTGMNPLANPGRIDFIYGTQSMMRDITHASTVKDYFTEIKSDHYPVMIEFRVYNQE